LSTRQWATQVAESLDRIVRDDAKLYVAERRRRLDHAEGAVG
jgi:hypothetical protein